MVVDDAESIRRMSRKVLEEAGFHVLLAEDVTEALRMLHCNRERIRAVVLDFSNSGKAAIELLKRDSARRTRACMCC